jgi:hypothetical protein
MLTVYSHFHHTGDNVHQQAIWHLTDGDLSTSANIANTNEAAYDIETLRVALRILLKTIWSSTTSEGASLLQDFASFVRLALPQGHRSSTFVGHGRSARRRR